MKTPRRQVKKPPAESDSRTRSGVSGGGGERDRHHTMMTPASDPGRDAELGHAPAPPSWALERAIAIVRRHGYGLANSTNAEARVQAAASLALAIAKALSEIASPASGRDQGH